MNFPQKRKSLLLTILEDPNSCVEQEAIKEQFLPPPPPNNLHLDPSGEGNCGGVYSCTVIT